VVKPSPVQYVGVGIGNDTQGSENRVVVAGNFDARKHGGFEGLETRHAEGRRAPVVDVRIHAVDPGGTDFRGHGDAISPQACSKKRMKEVWNCVYSTSS
jgi:hypothetical protein